MTNVIPHHVCTGSNDHSNNDSQHKLFFQSDIFGGHLNQASQSILCIINVFGERTCILFTSPTASCPGVNGIAAIVFATTNNPKF